MIGRYPTPEALMVALHDRVEEARAALRSALRDPLGRLLDQLVMRRGVDYDREILLIRTMHAVETYLRTRPINDFARMSEQAFRGAVLMQTARLLGQPFGHQHSGSQTGLLSLPADNGYESQILYQPHDRVGEFAFGGDWYAGMHAEDGSLWVIVADVTGHGYHAYLLASTLPDVWADCWRRSPPNREPADLLQSMHHMLESCLPEGVYLECTLARLDTAGQATVVPAGGSRVLLRRKGQVKPELLKLRGTWLGLFPPTRDDAHTWMIEEEGEMILATDGLFDHLDDDVLGELAGVLHPSSTLFETCRDLLQRELSTRSQHDDITMIHLRRRTVRATVVHAT